MKLRRRDSDTFYYRSKNGCVWEFFDGLSPMLFTPSFLTKETRKSINHCEPIVFEECPDWVQYGVKELQRLGYIEKEECYPKEISPCER